MNYSPLHQYVWDPWYMVTPTGVHLYHLQIPKDEEGRKTSDLLGHAVSADLVHWQELAPVLPPDRTNPDDDWQAWTGCALWHDRQAWLFFTMRGSRTKGQTQQLGLATSPDGSQFTRYSGNPVIRPDPHWFATLGNPMQATLDCRDLVVVKAPDRSGWYGYFATTRPAARFAPAGVIAVAYSEDLRHWEQQAEPAFAPENCGCIEVPNVFSLGGRWFMTCLAGSFYGTFDMLDEDDDLHSGTIYAVADSPRGPFRMLKDHVLLGATTGGCPLSIRHLEFEHEPYALYTDRGRTSGVDAGGYSPLTLSTPKLFAAEGDRLSLRYSPRVELLGARELPIDRERLKHDGVAADAGKVWRRPPVEAQITDTAIVLTEPTAYAELPLYVHPKSGILEATVTLLGAVRAGFISRIPAACRDCCLAGDFTALDTHFQGIKYTGFAWGSCDFLEKRHCAIEANRPYRLKLVLRQEFVEIYLEERLVTSFARYQGIGGDLALFVDRGTARFEAVRCRELEG